MDGNTEEVSIMIKDGINVNMIDTEITPTRSTPLIFSSQMSRKSDNKIVRMLLDAGADVNFQDNNGWTALKYASRFSNDSSTERTVKMLLEAKTKTKIIM